MARCSSHLKMMLLVVILAGCLLNQSFGFAPTLTVRKISLWPLLEVQLSKGDAKKTNSLSDTTRASRIYASSAVEPQVFASGYSPKLELTDALQEATEIALQALPKPHPDSAIHFALVTVSSLYDGQSSPTVVVPTLLKIVSAYGKGIQSLIGCTTGGIISSMANLDDTPTKKELDDDKAQPSACTTIENEVSLGVSVTLAILPDVQVKTFHVLGDDVPDEVGRMSSDSWKRAVGLASFGAANDVTDSCGPPIFMLIPSPSFQKQLDDLLMGIHTYFPSSTTFGGISSTVSSLSRARSFRYEVSDPHCVQTLADGCVGVVMQGDVEAKTMIARGAKPVGGIYRVVTGKDSTIGAIVLDEEAPEDAVAEDDDEQMDDKVQSAKEKAAAAYPKARIPKPVLAEANFLMKTLSDEDCSFMKKALLVGLERGGAIGRSPSEVARLAAGEGYQFRVQQVASAGMKDGSVTLPLGSVDVQPGMRLRFYVRESKFAKEELKALWMGYKKRELDRAFQTKDESDKKQFMPAACLLLSTLDRGTKFFGGKPGYESKAVSEFLPTLPCVSGYYSNGVIGRLDDTVLGRETVDTTVYGSASGFTLIGSKTGRPIFSMAQATAAEREAERKKAEKIAAEKAIAAEDDKRTLRTRSVLDLDKRAPRAANGELILKRREVHSGRAISVSTVEWSVAEKTAMPTSMLEGYMWDKETEVDRFRERVPLSNLVSQCRLSVADPKMPKPRDWIGPVRAAHSSEKFVIIPECKRIEPSSGSLRKRFDLAKLTREFTLAGAPALSVNCDGVLFGGSIEDITTARKVAGTAALEVSNGHDGIVPPSILASDLILYPYQLYKLRLAGADAVNLVGGALASKDLVYLTKIASSLQLQTLVTVTSTVQIDALTKLSKGSISGLIASNRELEDFSFDMTGKQALDLLKSDALASFREKHGHDIPVLVEGRVGIIERTDEAGQSSTSQYIKELVEAGAAGAIVGGGLAVGKEDDVTERLATLLESC